MAKIQESRLEDDARFIRRKLNEYNFARVPADKHDTLCLLARNGQEIVGGLLGGTYWNWLYVSYLWVDENERSTGIGMRIWRRMISRIWPSTRDAAIKCLENWKICLRATQSTICRSD
jgi:hypothetical protein